MVGSPPVQILHSLPRSQASFEYRNLPYLGTLHATRQWCAVSILQLERLLGQVLRSTKPEEVGSERGSAQR